jgi:hypothetical protein
MSLHTDTLYPRRGSRGVSDIPPRHPRFTKISYSPRASASHLLRNVMGQEKTGESVMEKISST